MMRNLRSLIRASKKAADVAANLQRDLDALRDRLTALRERREAIKDAPLPRDEAERLLRDQIAGFAKGFCAWPGNIRCGGAMPAYEFGETFKGNPLQALCAIAPEGVFNAYAWTLAAEGEGMTAEQREAALAEVDSECADLARVEEAMLRGAERAGLDVIRRADADPAIVLAPDQALPL